MRPPISLSAQLAQKGSSVLLFRTRALRRAQFTPVTQWSGGLYVTPSQAGSRPGGLVAQTWAAMVSMGRSGYVDAARRVMASAKIFREGIGGIPELEVLGDPDMCVVAFAAAAGARAGGVDVYAVNDVMAAKGWHLNALQMPPAVHVCLTLAHEGAVGDLLADLRAAVEEVKRHPEGVKGGMAPIYGTAAAVPDRGAVGDLLMAVQDVMLQ